MYWRLSETVTACIASGRVLLLDVARDRYLALPRAHEASFIDWIERADQAPPPPCHSSLVKLGIAQPDAWSRMVPVACSVSMPAYLDADRLPAAALSARTLLRVGRRVAAAWRDVRSRQLGAVLARRFPQIGDLSADREEMRRRLTSFRSARPYIPVPRVCLHDCLALWDWLGPHRAGVQLVLGVSAFPFAAHCWLQADGRVIDDHPESPSRFQPILHLP